MTIGVLLRVIHFLGLGVAIGAATVKLLLLLKARANTGFVGTYLAVSGQITRLIVIGTMLLVVSGVGWLLIGYPLTGLLIFKMVLAAVVVVLGASMDKVIEPKFHKLAPMSGGPASPEFIRVRQQYVLAEAVATGLFFVIVVMWVLR